MDKAPIWLVLAAGAAMTYLPRGIGVALAGRINPNSAVFRWVSCVAYALLAGLIARMIILPIGALQHTALSTRLISAAIALLAYYAARKNILVGCAVGVAVFALLTQYGAAL